MYTSKRRIHHAPCPQGSILRFDRDPLLSTCRCRWPLLRPRARRGLASLTTLDLPQKYPSHPNYDLTRSIADDCPREARHAEECVYWVEGERNIQADVIRQDDEQIEEDSRSEYEWGKEIDGDGDDGQEWREKRKEKGFEEPDCI